MRFDSFVPRSNSKVILAAVIACYTWTLTSITRLLVYLCAKPPPTGRQTTHTAGQWIVHFFGGIVVAPLLESLILIGLVELLRLLKCPKSAQIIFPALVMGLLHSSSWGLRSVIAAPAFGVWAAAYLYCKDISLGVRAGYAIIVAAHLLHNLIPALGDLVYET